MAKYLNGKQLQQALFKRTEGYAENVRNIYNAALGQIIDLVKGTELEDGVPFSFSEYGYSDQVTPILRKMYSKTYQTIRSGVEKEWILANENNDELIKAVFGKDSIDSQQFARFFMRNKEAMDAFFARKSEGMDLSQRVWRYTGMYKDELENTLDLAIGEGTPANRLATQIKQYLQEPDMFFRRFRVKTGEDEFGNPVYGRIWKRRVYDKETESYKWINADPKDYHSGNGVYRSSYRNAQRLARTETNMAYRVADFDRWQSLDFVVGIEIKLSNNHPCDDICDVLNGIYPKTFKWTGWHPNCRCYAVPVLAKPEEVDEMVDKILDGDDPGTVSVAGAVKQMPDHFKEWVLNNEQRIIEAKNGLRAMPYFVKENIKTVDRILKPLTPEEQKYQDLVDQYGEEEVKALYNAYDAFKNKISVGDLAYQKKKLLFEIKWVADKNKFKTSGEMVKLLQEELSKVEQQILTEEAIKVAKPLLLYKSKSKVLKEIQEDLKIAVQNRSSAKEIQDLTAKAEAKIKEIEKARLAKIVKKGGNGNTIEIYATPEEKLELARLQDLYDKAMDQYGSQWNYTVNDRYRALAEYKKELAHKYLKKQGKVLKLNGETDESAAQCLDDYIHASMDHSAMSPVGGQFQKISSEESQIRAYAKKYGISEDELGLINRYSYGSKWINRYSYGIAEPGYGVRDYGGLCPKYIQATNAALEKMPRYNGRVFSGIDFDSATLQKYITEMKDCLAVGKPYTNKALMSSSTDVNVTSIFGRNVTLVIDSKKGVDIKPISHYKGEDEVVFRAGAQFKVKAVYQETVRKFGFGGDSWVIEMEEI